MNNPHTIKKLFVVGALALTTALASGAAHAESNAGTPPSAPRDVKVTVKGSSAIVAWSAPSTTGTSRIDGYTASTAGSSSCVTTELTCTITGLVRGQTYDITVRADSWAGLGDLSNKVSISVPYSFESLRGKNAALTTEPATTFATHTVVRAVAGGVHVGVRIPRSATTNSQIIRYTVQLFDASNAAVAKSAAGGRPGRPASAFVGAAAGTYRVYVTAQKKDGSKVTWAGPSVIVS